MVQDLPSWPHGDVAQWLVRHPVTVEGGGSTPLVIAEPGSLKGVQAVPEEAR